jgi:DNA-binding MarR family transcriptional regulator
MGSVCRTCSCYENPAVGKIPCRRATILRTLTIRTAATATSMTLQLETTTRTELPTLAEPAFLALVRTFGLLRRVMEPYFARFGISGAQWGVLRTLHRETALADSTTLSLSDLGDRLIVRPPSVTGVVDRLQRMGLVARTTSTTDQRVKFVRLTDRGRVLVDRILEDHPRQIANVLSGLDVPAQQDLRRLLERLEPHLASVADQVEVEAKVNRKAKVKRSA